MSDALMDELEGQLLAAGRAELKTTSNIADLRLRCRKAGEAGEHDKADAIWARIEDAEATLRNLKDAIAKLETRLYGLRRRRR